MAIKLDPEYEHVPMLNTISLRSGIESRRFGVVRDAFVGGIRYFQIIPMEQLNRLAQSVEAGATSFAELPEIDLVWVRKDGDQVWPVTDIKLLDSLDKVAGEAIFG